MADVLIIANFRLWTYEKDMPPRFNVGHANFEPIEARHTLHIRQQSGEWGLAFNHTGLRMTVGHVANNVYMLLVLLFTHNSPGT